jgi:hypothetical protein
MGSAHAALMVLGVQTTAETVRQVSFDLADTLTFLSAATIASSDSSSPESSGSGADAALLRALLVMAWFARWYSFVPVAVAALKL